MQLRIFAPFVASNEKPRTRTRRETPAIASEGRECALGRTGVCAGARGTACACAARAGIGLPPCGCAGRAGKRGLEMGAASRRDERASSAAWLPLMGLAMHLARERGQCVFVVETGIMAVRRLASDHDQSAGARAMMIRPGLARPAAGSASSSSSSSRPSLKVRRRSSSQRCSITITVSSTVSTSSSDPIGDSEARSPLLAAV